MPLELIHQTQGLRILAEGIAPGSEAVCTVLQFQRAHAGMVVVLQHTLAAVGPLLPLACAGRLGDELAVGGDQHAGREVEIVVEIGFEPGEDVFVLRQQRFGIKVPGLGNGVASGNGIVGLNCHGWAGAPATADSVGGGSIPSRLMRRSAAAGR